MNTEELKKTIVPESELDGMPMAIYPQWTKETVWQLQAPS